MEEIRLELFYFTTTKAMQVIIIIFILQDILSLVFFLYTQTHSHTQAQIFKERIRAK